jgi:hypothetical protein
MPARNRPSQALVVGVSQYLYTDKLRPTKGPQAVFDVLTSPAVCGYPQEQVTLLEEGAATRQAVLDALRATCTRAASADARTFVYFMGHGGQDAAGMAYYLPVDARRGEHATTAISARDLFACFDTCRGELTVVLDCCRAASLVLAPDAGGGLGPFTNALEVAIRSASSGGEPPTNRVIIAASSATGPAWVSPDAPYSILTGHLVACLRGAPREAVAGVNVTISGLFQYVDARVRRDSGGAQTPLFIGATGSMYEVTDYPRPVAPIDAFERDVFISYDRNDAQVEDWLKNIVVPQLVQAKLSMWDLDNVGDGRLARVAVAKCRYVVAVLTRGYVEDRTEEFGATMAMVDAIEFERRRFIPILRERFVLPPDINAFVAIDMTPPREMQFPKMMDRLIARLKKPVDQVG